MADSTLDPDNFGQRDRSLGKGHGTRALGPSDLSDTGSDVVGADGLGYDEALALDTGTNSDPEYSIAGHTAGPDLGDADLSDDSDSSGTGEYATAGRDMFAEAGRDISVDQIQQIPDLSEMPLDDEVDDSMDPDKDPGRGEGPARNQNRTGKQSTQGSRPDSVR